VRVKGKNNIPQDKNYIIISNHLNWSDPLFILMNLPSSPKIIFIAENEGIYDTKAQKRFIDFMGKPIVPIERDNPKSRIKALRAMMSIIRSGNNLAVFPEGRLGHAEGQIFPFYLGVFSIAKKMNIPILPVTISGTKRLSLRNPVEIQIGELMICKKMKVMKILVEELL
jgi:1-acyl-sn-glycerol-3-phosphate acyltransferase